MPGSLGTLAGAIAARLNQRRSQVILIELSSEDDSPTGQYLPFQHFPDTISDTKAVNYQQKTIPGGSLPLYQWMDSGERLISFTAVFATDNDLDQTEGLAERLASAGEKTRNIDIRTALVWLRRYLFPSYGDRGDLGVPLARAPRKLLLFIPGSKIGMMGCMATDSVQDSVVCVMTQCDITYEMFFPNGNPRIATVQLSFAQVPQRNGSVLFPSVTQAMDDYVNTGYTLVPVSRRR